MQAQESEFQVSRSAANIQIGFLYENYSKGFVNRLNNEMKSMKSYE